ncbi:MAG: alpha/beta hydrolase [bacterium]|nr:alpha/beta hydrolase [bacterium]
MKRRRLPSRLFIGLGLLLIVVVVALIVVFVVLPGSAPEGTARVRPASSLETIGETEFRHYFTEAAGFTWHSVEAGEGQPILFIHGIPGAWYSWHRVMALLADDYRVIAIDLKGLGLSDQPEGSYSAEVVAGEIVQLMDAIDVDTFAVVGHEWGSIVASYVAALHPDRVTHFVRLQAPLSEAALNQIQTLRNIPQIGATILADGEGFVRRMYTGESGSFLMSNVPGNIVAQPIPEEDIARIVQEFTYEGIPDAIIRYYTDSAADLRSEVARLAPLTTMPTLLLQGDSDPIQPLSFYEDATAGFPNATFTVIPDCGHVPMLEQPDAVAALIRDFMGADI